MHFGLILQYISFYWSKFKMWMYSWRANFIHCDHIHLVLLNVLILLVMEFWMEINWINHILRFFINSHRIHVSMYEFHTWISNCNKKRIFYQCNFYQKPLVWLFWWKNVWNFFIAWTFIHSRKKYSLQLFLGLTIFMWVFKKI